MVATRLASERRHLFVHGSLRGRSRGKFVPGALVPSACCGSGGGDHANGGGGRGRILQQRNRINLFLFWDLAYLKELHSSSRQAFK